MTTLGASDDIVLAGASAVTLQTKSGTKRIRLRRCTRLLRLSNDLIVQCTKPQHNVDNDPTHEYHAVAFSPDGTARDVMVTWTELGNVAPIITGRKS